MRILIGTIFMLVTGCASHPVVNSSGSQELIGFSSSQGLKMFESAKSKVDFFMLANNFESQQNGLFCGPTTAAIVLNSFRIRGDVNVLPKDLRGVELKDRKFLPAQFDPLVQRYTPNTIVDKGSKPRAEVFGKPVKSNGKEIQDFGYQLRQFAALLTSYGLNVKLHVVDDKLSEEKIRKDILKNLATKDDYVLVNYKRADVGQTGGGHISPLGAYDEASDRVLVMDVNPTKAEWVWMPVATLIQGMRTFDTVENRGYVLVSEKR